MMRRCCASLWLAVLMAGGGLAGGQASAQSSQELAKELANPIANLTSVPFQYNWDEGYGPRDGAKGFVNIQPVIPFKLGKRMTLVTRTIVPVAHQNDIAGKSGEQFGLGDTLQSFFLVPATVPTRLGSFTWGAGPAIAWPTSTHRLLGTGDLGLGPTAVALMQKGGWTYGALVNHVWSVEETRSTSPGTNRSYLQPFLSYSTKDAWTFTLNSESGYDWQTHDWGVPLNLLVSKLTSIGRQKVQFQVGARTWADSAIGGAEGWGFRATTTFLFPKQQ